MKSLFLFVGTILSLLVDVSGFPSRKLKGECKDGNTISGEKCTKHGHYQVKQCPANSDLCNCVHPWHGKVTTTRVKKEEDCPPCLLHNAQSYKMTAEGMMDMNVYDCSDDGYFNDAKVQCMWHDCFCFSKMGDKFYVITQEDYSNDDFSCKSVDESKFELKDGKSSESHPADHPADLLL